MTGCGKDHLLKSVVFPQPVIICLEFWTTPMLKCEKAYFLKFNYSGISDPIVSMTLPCKAAKSPCSFRKSVLLSQ